MTSPCARCAHALGRSCCEVGEGERLATLTRADVARVRAFTGRAERHFVVQEWLTQDEAHAYEQGRPLYQGYFRRENARWTLGRKEGACVFLDRAKGCTLSLDARPLACRLYPFEPLEDAPDALLVERHGSILAARGQESACLAVEEASTTESLRSSLGVSPEDLERLRAQLRDEVQAHGRAV